MANRVEVERSLQELIERLRGTDDARASLRESVPETRVLTLHVSDLDMSYWAELVEGHLGDPTPGAPEESAHTRIRAASDDLVALVDGELTFVSAYLTGRVRVDAGVADMLQLRRML